MGFIKKAFIIFFASVALVCFTPLSSQDSKQEGKGKDARRFQKAVKRAIKYLKRSQRRSGAWEGDWGGASANITLTSLAGLAFLATGSTHKDGPYKEQIKRALKYILKQVQNPQRNSSHVNFQLAFALLFLAEVYRTDPDRKIEKAINKIVKRYKRYQSKKEGGWSYFGRVSFKTQKDYPLLATTISIVTGLGAAKGAGIKVPQKMLDKGIKYIERCANKNGGFRYAFKLHGILKRNPKAYRRSDHARTGSAICALLLSKKDSERLKPGIEYFKKGLGKIIKNYRAEHYWFNLFFGSIASYKIGGELWERWDRKVKKKLASIQKKRGYWKATGYSHVERMVGTKRARRFSILFATSIALFVLELNKGELHFLKKT